MENTMQNMTLYNIAEACCGRLLRGALAAGDAKRRLPVRKLIPVR